jgi:hypothetical protein
VHEQDPSTKQVEALAVEPLARERQLRDQARQLKLRAMPSTVELEALARRDPSAAIRVLDDFGDWLSFVVQELLEEWAGENAHLYDDEDDPSSAAYDAARDWLVRLRPDISREETRLQLFARNLARTTSSSRSYRTAARQHWHWAWWGLRDGLHQRRLDRRGAPLRARSRSGSRPRERRARRARSSASSSRGEPSDSDDDEADPARVGAIVVARRRAA